MDSFGNIIGNIDGSNLTAHDDVTRGSVTNGNLVDARLAPLGDHGSVTLPDGTKLLTHAFADTSSPAINAGHNTSGLATDQNGQARSQSIAPDAGAFESDATTSPPTGTLDDAVSMGRTETRGKTSLRFAG